MKDSVKILQFTVRDVFLGCDITELEQILPMMTLEHVPNAPHHLQGMMNLYGMLIPVFDLASYLQLPLQSYDLDTSILLTKSDNKPVGFIVDHVIEMFTVKKNKIQQGDLFKEKKSPYVGNVVIQNKPCLILEFAYIIKDVHCFTERN